MDTVSFLRRVLPSDGFYVCFTANKDERPRQGFFASVDALADSIESLNQRGNNTYYAVASFQDKASRTQQNVHKLKTLFLDIDCGEGKPFVDWKAGLVALGRFVLTNNLPKPMIVASGNGLHAYWVLDTELSRDEWQPYADALKALIPTDQETGRPVFDPSVPADAARVLRPIGTVNPKGGGNVRLLVDAPPISLTAIEHLHKPIAQPQIVPVKRSSLLDALAVRQEFPPASAAVLQEKCQQIAWAVENQGDVPEPFWYALLGVAAACEDPEGVAVEWSQKHPSFDKTETLRKLHQWKGKTTGPTSCSKFEEERPDGCKKCRFKGTIGTPARLGLQYQAVDVVADAPDEASTVVPLPRPYKRTAQGIKRTVDGTDIDLCSFDIYPLGYGRDESLGYETVRFRWNRPHAGWQTLAFRQAYLTEQAIREFASTIADQGIVLYNKGQTENFQQMLRSYMDELRKLRAMTNLYSSMGWKEDNKQFLLGDTIIRQDASGKAVQDTASISSAAQRSADAMYGQAGTAESWAQFTALLQKANMPIHMFALCVSFSAPLYQFTGLKGLTINLYGPTGAGKTLGQLWQQSVWGDPTKLHYTAKFTQNALFARMGMYNNLPVTIDETTMLPPKEVGDFLYWVSQGRDKARLTRSAEERDHKTWATVVTTSANRSMASMLAASGLETDAQMARLLELTIGAHPLFTRSTTAGKQIYEFVSTNYGVVGRVFMERLVALGEDGIRAALAHHRSTFNARYGCAFVGNERYWEQGIQLADFAGSLAADLGLIQFDHTHGIATVLKQIGAMRKAVQDNAYDTFDLISEYLNEFAATTLHVIHTTNPKPFVNETRLPRGELHIRFDLFSTSGAVIGPFDRGTILLDRRHFKHWLAIRGADYRSVVRDIVDQGANATPPSEKAYLGKDSPIRIGQQYVLGVDLGHPRLVGVLRDADTAATNAVVSASFGVIQGGKP